MKKLRPTLLLDPLVAWLADHGKRVLGDKMIYVTCIVGVLLIGYGVYLLGRAGWYVFEKLGWI